MHPLLQQPAITSCQNLDTTNFNNSIPDNQRESEKEKVGGLESGKKEREDGGRERGRERGRRRDRKRGRERAVHTLTHVSIYIHAHKLFGDVC